MRRLPRIGYAFVGSVILFGCHNQSTDDDRGQAMRGKQPDSLAVPPQPVVATSAGPASSVPAANLAATVPAGPAVHDGAIACSVQVGNMGTDGRQLTAQNTGNVGIRECRVAVYVYDKTHAQIARVSLQALAADGGGVTLPPKGAARSLLPLPALVARDESSTFVPVVVHVTFDDGATWDAPADRAPEQRPFSRGNRLDAVN